MSVYFLTISTTALFAALFANKLPNAKLWVVSIWSVYAFTNWWAANDVWHPLFVSALCDGALAFMMLMTCRTYRERWQLFASLIVIFMMFANLFYMAAGESAAHFITFATAVEGANIAAFILIGGTGISELLGRNVSSGNLLGPLGHIRAFMRALVAQRA